MPAKGSSYRNISVTKTTYDRVANVRRLLLRQGLDALPDGVRPEEPTTEDGYLSVSELVEVAMRMVEKTLSEGKRPR